MTRKDYYKIAEVLRFAESIENRTHQRLVQDFCDMFKRDNPNFDASKFKAACEPEDV